VQWILKQVQDDDSYYIKLQYINTTRLHAFINHYSFVNSHIMPEITKITNTITGLKKKETKPSFRVSRRYRDNVSNPEILNSSVLSFSIKLYVIRRTSYVKNKDVRRKTYDLRFKSSQLLLNILYKSIQIQFVSLQQYFYITDYNLTAAIIQLWR
jgi:hypothetical protein